MLPPPAANAGTSECSKAEVVTKASFCVVNAKWPNVPVKDREFWEKMMPEVEFAPDANIPALPRRRRRGRRTVRHIPKDEGVSAGTSSARSGDEGPVEFGADGEKPFDKDEHQFLLYAFLCMGCAGPLATDRHVDEIARFCMALMLSCSNVVKADKVEVHVSFKSVLKNAFPPHRTIREGSKTERKKQPKKWKHEETRNGDDLLGSAVLERANFADQILEAEEFKLYLARNGVSMLKMELVTNIRTLGLDGSLEAGREMPVVGASGSDTLGDFWDASFYRV